MVAAAFVSSFLPRVAPTTQPTCLRQHAKPLRFSPAPRAPLRMNADPEKPDSNPDSNPAAQSSSTFDAPSFDTDVFSKFVDSAQQRIDSFQQSVQEIDPTEFVDNTKQASLGLADNFIAGDWLNRGELYGAIQLAFVLFLVRGGGALDFVVSFLAGPALLVVGAFISGKAVFDLGLKQLSIWPAPVPNGELQTSGLYEYVRHPMYSGVVLASVGFAVATGSPSRLALTIAFAAFLSKKIDVEEQFLKDVYPAYEDYTEDVPYKLIPNIV